MVTSNKRILFLDNLCDESGTDTIHKIRTELILAISTWYNQLIFKK